MMPPPPNTFVSMGATINKEPLSPPGPESSVDTDDISPGVWVCGGYNQPGTHGSTKVVMPSPAQGLEAKAWERGKTTALCHPCDWGR